MTRSEAFKKIKYYLKLSEHYKEYRMIEKYKDVLNKIETILEYIK